MAASCPRCGNLIDQDFGVAACAECQAILFINMDGQAQITETPPSHSSSEAQADRARELPPLDQDPDEDRTQMTSDPLNAQEAPQKQGDSPIEAVSKGGLLENSGGGFYQSPELVHGAISYCVRIQNIDTKEVRILLMEALSDSKFQWDVREVMRTIKNGELELRNLNPVKASVIVQRTRLLPVKISWKQDVYK